MSDVQLWFVRSTAGATSNEYALIAMSAALVIVAAVGGVGVNLSAYYGAIAAALP
jgi:Flp pilus assembly pilin Flp